MHRTKAFRATQPDHPSADPYVEHLTRMGNLAVRCGERLTAFQAHGCSLALAELARMHQAYLQSADDHPLPAQWPALAQSQALRSTEIICGWWEAALRIQDATLAALRECFDATAIVEAIPDRRLRHVVVPFPDRRAA